MSELPQNKAFDLAERTRIFASDCRSFVRKARTDAFLRNDVDQLIRSSGSVAANYLEADEALSKKDFIMRIKICRKEARESMLWLDLLLPFMEEATIKRLKNEAYQLVKIFNAIINKAT